MSNAPFDCRYRLYRVDRRLILRPHVIFIECLGWCQVGERPSIPPFSCRTVR